MVSARSFLVPFKFSENLTYILEFSPLKLRIYAQGQKIVLDDEPNEGQFFLHTSYYDRIGDRDIVSDANEDNVVITTPYTYSDLWDEDELCFKLQTIQHSDVLYIFSENYPIKVLKRFSATNWQLSTLQLAGGPFEAMNSGDTTMTSSNSVGGYVTLTTSADVFCQTDVGRLVRMRAYDDSLKVWAAGVSVTATHIYVSDNKYYEAQNSGTTGSNKPVHTEGIRSDGGVRWKYVHDGMGIVRITQYNGPREVIGEIVKRMPDAVMVGTKYWELGLLHGGAKYPKSGAFFRNRFAFLVNTNEGPKVCLSAAGDYNNFADTEYGETTAESAITVPVLGTEYNEGKWLFAGDVLFVGTGSSEFYIDTISSSSALAHDNIKISKISNVGSKAIMPVAIGAHTFFADRYGLSLRDLSYNYYNDGYDQIDITLLGKHLFSSRIVAMCYQEVPDKILWCLIGDGTLTALTFSAEQEVAALSRHDFDGKVESIAVASNMNSCQDELWLEVQRICNTKVLRTVEYMENGMPLSLNLIEARKNTLALKKEAENTFIRQQARYLDGSVLFVREAEDNAVEISGLEHLEGEYVTLFADGSVREKRLVVNGKVSIAKTDMNVLVGKEIISQYIPQACYIDDENGSGIGEKQCIDHVVMMLYATGGGKIGEDEAQMSDILYRNSDDKLNEPTALFTGNKKVLFNGSTNAKNEAATVLIENRSPLPMNILAIVCHVG